MFVVDGQFKPQSYKKLFTYWFSVIIYDKTVEFTDTYIKSWKLKEQMVGAARSGKQNIVEGSDDLRTSIKIGIKLCGTSKGSIEELIGDMEDFLRQRKLKKYSKNEERIILFRKRVGLLVRTLSSLGNLGLQEHDYERRVTENLARVSLPPEPETAANFLLTLCHQLSFLLEKQIQGLEDKHKREGGFTEKLYTVRKSYLKHNS
ncbi:hypothetical protein CO179_05690 [candidate division WWE3 bacterium CG_4_9_14_3_um_filter_39_7]|uniref:Four helix bundle protein n=1 Tax=candidate division WWE3 bacterium CG_4_9_14_3_um_filter_39_7 TaxID=1975080 RepID=A0A2M7WZW6_UNCKA|nr:MAG: hypothetical protein CO179_05690 [candidate division WWE3 bacterium CG_4_9_14_3_um_filter_39_7]